MELKLLGAVLLVLAGTAAGQAAAKRRQKIAAALQQYQNLMQYIRILALAGNYSPDEILCKAIQQGSYPELALSGTVHLREYRLPPWLPPSANALSGVFPEIGTLQKEELGQLLMQYDQLARELEKIAKENACKANKLYTKAGTLTGLLLAVLLL